MFTSCEFLLFSSSFHKEQQMSVNMSKLAERMSAEMLAVLFKMAAGECADMVMSWAEENGAEFEDKDKAREDLAKLFPKPSKYPAIVVNTKSSTASTSTAAPGKKKSEGRKAADYNMVKPPKGIEFPTCKAILKTKKEPCGKKASRSLDCHDPENNEDCKLLKCNCCFCGTHITKAASQNAADIMGSGSQNKDKVKKAAPGKEKMKNLKQKLKEKAEAKKAAARKAQEEAAKEAEDEDEEELVNLDEAEEIGLEEESEQPSVVEEEEEEEEPSGAETDSEEE